MRAVRSFTEPMVPSAQSWAAPASSPARAWVVLACWDRVWSWAETASEEPRRCSDV